MTLALVIMTVLIVNPVTVLGGFSTGTPGEARDSAASWKCRDLTIAFALGNILI
jgi:hypothetical protein